jgi:CBS domain-containing membrane protein
MALVMTAMHYLRCIHPPGGATALVAVMGGPNIQSLGYHYVIMPVLLNVMVLLVMAIVINYAFPWRRYPACLKSPQPHAGPPQEEDNETHQSFTHSDLEYALKQLNSFIDVTEEDLDKIYILAVQHAQNTSQLTLIEEIAMGHYYSNGQYGETWAIRQVIAISKETDDISYRVVAGKDCRQMAICSPAEFVQWARYEVERDDNSWRRVR